MPRFAANLSWLFTDAPFAARFDRAAAAGFTAVEFMFPYNHAPGEVAGWLRGAGLECVLMNAPPGDWEAGERGLAGLPGRREAFRRSIDTALTYADALACPRIHVMAGLKSHGAMRSTLEANLAWAAAKLASAGRALMVEAINRHDMPGYLVGSHAEAVAVHDAVGAANLRLQADLYHMQKTGGDLTATLTRDIARIGHVQVSAVPDRGEPDAGELNHPHLFATLDALGYAGWVGCEYRPRGATTEAGLGWLDRWR